MSKQLLIHRDRLGILIVLGDFVAYPDNNQLRIGSVTKLNAKMINIMDVNKRYGTTRKYPADTVKLGGSELTMYILKNSS
jgi:hypothetical protein